MDTQAHRAQLNNLWAAFQEGMADSENSWQVLPDRLRARGLLVPLVDAGISQADVQAFWRAQPFDLALEFHDGGVAAGNCDLCFLKGPNQIKSLIAAKPERAIWWAKQEELVGATFRSDRPSYAVMMHNASAQQDFIGHDEETIACFCGD